MNRCTGVIAVCLAASLAAFFGLGTLAAGAAAPTASVGVNDPGIRIINDLARGNCGSCHALPGQLPGQVGAQSTFGPSLQGVGSRLARLDLRQWVADPRRIRPDTLMPAFGTVSGLNRPWPNRPILTELEIEQVVDTLQSWR